MKLWPWRLDQKLTRLMRFFRILKCLLIHRDDLGLTGPIGMRIYTERRLNVKWRETISIWDGASPLWFSLAQHKCVIRSFILPCLRLKMLRENVWEQKSGSCLQHAPSGLSQMNSLFGSECRVNTFTFQSAGSLRLHKDGRWTVLAASTVERFINQSINQSNFLNTALNQDQRSSNPLMGKTNWDPPEQQGATGGDQEKDPPVG